MFGQDLGRGGEGRGGEERGGEWRGGEGRGGEENGKMLYKRMLQILWNKRSYDSYTCSNI